MKKKILATLDKCYSIAPLRYKNTDHLLVAAEKTDRCILFDSDGREEETVWEGPGGVMSMVQIPGSEGQFLATQKFYSPNDSKEAKIVLVTPENGKWTVRTLVRLPFVHRFDILESDGRHYLIACCLKSGHEYKDDWSSPGKVYAALLPQNMDCFDEAQPLKLEVIQEGLLKNHGYCRVQRDGRMSALVCSENGVLRFYPPTKENENWTIQTLLDTPASDAVLTDLDGDGRDELLIFSPFHGDTIRIYREKDGKYELDYEYPEKLDFLHAIWSGEIQGKPSVLIGHRKGQRNLMRLYWENGAYQAEVIDRDCGPANVYLFQKNGKDYAISANREINEIAMYEF